MTRGNALTKTSWTRKDFAVNLASKGEQPLHFREIAGFPHVAMFKVLSFSDSFSHTVEGHSSLGSETWALLIKRQGTTVFKYADDAPPVVVPPRSIFFCRAKELDMRVIKGEHDSTLLLWKTEALPRLAQWFEKSKRITALQSISLGHLDSIRALDEVLAHPGRAAEMQIIGFVYSTIGKLMSTKDHIDLADLPVQLPDSLVPLIEKVRRNPSDYWPVPEAASVAGYSPHHFSRVFKQACNMKFQEFVERCRLGYAIEMLLSSRYSVETIAEKAGFGAPQALREACKEILGVMPSDLRGFANTSVSNRRSTP